MTTFKLNGKDVTVTVPEQMPLLWVLRDELGMTGTKYGCGIAQCGACTVLFDGQAVRSCQVPISIAEGISVTTIEGLGSPQKPHPIQEAWIENQVAQCGYCQSGQMMQAASLLKQYPDPTDEDINRVMNGNLCRCGSYPKIREAVKSASLKMRGE